MDLDLVYIVHMMEDIEHMGHEEFEKVILHPAVAQNFSFKNSSINYILQNANYAVLQKLYKCCQYFYFKRPFVIVDKLRLFKASDFQIFSTFPRYKNAFQLRNLWLTGLLEICTTQNEGWDDENILKNITRNDIKVLTVKTEEISFRNLQILCNSPNLTNVTINAKIRGDDNQLVSFEDILALLPNIQRFNLCHCYCTPETPDKLLALKFGKKIQRLRFKYIKSDIDPKKFFLFLVKNLANNAIVAIKFDSMIPYDRRQQLTGILTAIMRGWNAKYPLKIFISFFR